MSDSTSEHDQRQEVQNQKMPNATPEQKAAEETVEANTPNFQSSEESEKE